MAGLLTIRSSNLLLTISTCFVVVDDVVEPKLDAVVVVAAAVACSQAMKY